MYRIKWESKLTGFVGQGACIFTKDEAQKICNKLNEHPDINHEVISDKEDK